MSQTIAAIASGTAPAAIGVVRISGDDALQIVQNCLKNKNLSPRMMHHRILFDAAHLPVDDVLVCWFKAPHSYTGEESVEIYAHGGAVNLGRVLDAVCAAGARPAQPGEFSKRAFLNGKIDLSRAEAIMDIIHAQNDLQCREAQKQLSGSVSSAVETLRSTVLALLCSIEASIDFSTEEELAPLPVERIKNEANSVIDQIERMKRAHEAYRNAGIHVALVGTPNAGKSSLFNKLLGRERAIVTNIAGTTTDTIEASVRIQGESFLLIDTAGLTETQNPIEAIGVQRARQQIQDADIIIAFIDGENPSFDVLDEIQTVLGDRFQAFLAAQNCLCVHTKADLPSRPALPSATPWIDKFRARTIPLFEISTYDRTGIDALENTLVQYAKKRQAEFDDVALITSQRHINCLCEAEKALQRSLSALEQHLPAECIASDLHEAARELALITGAFVGDDIVNEIFSHFCIGK